ncbi:MAG TPA: BlaI/MecI/CopY family transcriptional regulator [Gemmatimonadaceae bacterium]|nr:BlaI/MecI/CopY family transcriptional regulator [Gemmatimonadaceae bacterium]
MKERFQVNPDAHSRRERQILDALYKRGEASAREISEEFSEPEALDSIRVILGALEKKGVVKHRVDGKRFIYKPARPADRARRSAWSRLTATFFEGSPSKAILGMIDLSGDRLSDDDFQRLSEWVTQQARVRRKKRSG